MTIMQMKLSEQFGQIRHIQMPSISQESRMGMLILRHVDNAQPSNLETITLEYRPSATTNKSIHEIVVQGMRSRGNAKFLDFLQEGIKHDLHALSQITSILGGLNADREDRDIPPHESVVVLELDWETMTKSRGDKYDTNR